MLMLRNGLRGSSSLLKQGTRNYSNKTPNQQVATGSYEKVVYKGYNVNSFIPKELPPKINLKFVHPSIGIPLDECLAEADENLAELKLKSSTLPLSMQTAFLKREAVGSCQIELNTKSLTDIMKEACGFMISKNKNEKVEFDETLQYIEAMQLGLRLISKEAMSLEMIEAIHKASTGEKPGHHYSAEVVPGKIRTSQIAIGGSSIPPYTSAFFPPPPKHLRRLLDNFVNFINEPSDMHPLIKVGIAHAQFETIHPFYAGNGKLGRLMLMLHLLRSGAVDKFSLYPSYAFKVSRWLYFNSLQDTRNSGVWEPWLQFFVSSISHSARDAIELCDDLSSLHLFNKQAVGGNSRRSDIDEKKTDKLLDICYRMPFVTKQMVAFLFGEDYSVAHELLDLFTRRGILEIVRDERNEVWYCNRAIIDELNKERHVATLVSLLGGWMRVPPKVAVTETVVSYSTFEETFATPPAIEQRT